MDVVLFFVVLVGLAVFVALPLYHQSGGPHEGGARQTVDPTVRLLAELEVDLASGLITEEEYREQRQVLEDEALGSSL